MVEKSISTYAEFAAAYPPDAKGVHHVSAADFCSTLAATITLPPGHSLNELSGGLGCISGDFTKGQAQRLSSRGRGRW